MLNESEIEQIADRVVLKLAPIIRAKLAQDNLIATPAKQKAVIDNIVIRFHNRKNKLKKDG